MPCRLHVHGGSSGREKSHLFPSWGRAKTSSALGHRLPQGPLGRHQVSQDILDIVKFLKAFLDVVKVLKAILDVVKFLKAILDVLQLLKAILEVVKFLKAILDVVNFFKAFLNVVMFLKAILDIVELLNAILDVVKFLKAILDAVKFLKAILDVVNIILPLTASQASRFTRQVPLPRLSLADTPIPSPVVCDFCPAQPHLSSYLGLCRSPRGITNTNDPGIARLHYPRLDPQTLAFFHNQS